MLLLLPRCLLLPVLFWHWESYNESALCQPWSILTQQWKQYNRKMIMFDHMESLCCLVTRRVTSPVTRDVPVTHGATPSIFEILACAVLCTIKIKQGYQTVTSLIQNITQNRSSVCCKNSVFICKIGFLGLRGRVRFQGQRITLSDKNVLCKFIFTKSHSILVIIRRL